KNMQSRQNEQARESSERVKQVVANYVAPAEENLENAIVSARDAVKKELFELQRNGSSDDTIIAFANYLDWDVFKNIETVAQFTARLNCLSVRVGYLYKFRSAFEVA